VRDLVQKLIRRYPGWVVSFFVLATLVFGYGALRVTMATDVTNFFSEDDPRVVLFNETQDTFGSSEYIMLAVEAQEVFSLSGIADLDRLTEALSAVEGVDTVRSLTSIENIRGSEWGIEVSPMLSELPTTQDEVEAFRRQVMEDNQLAGKLVSEDGAFTLILLTLDEWADNDATVNAIRAAIGEACGDMTVHLTGGPVLNQVMNEALRSDLLRLSPLVVILILSMLFLSFRNWQGVLLPLLTMLISMTWTLGLMGFTGVPLTQLSAILPAVFTSVGSAYGIHVLHRYRGEVTQVTDNRERVERVVRQVGPAVFMAGATTAAGFLSNAFSSIIRIREFGLLTAFGVLVALVVSTVMIPSILLLVGKRSERGWSRSVEQGEAAFLARFGGWVARHRGVVAVIAFGIVVVAALGLPRLSVETDFINFFEKGSPTRNAFDLVQEHFGGTGTIQIVVDGSITEPEVLRAMETAQEQLKAIPHLSTPLSVVDLVKRVSRVLHADDPAYERIPDTREAIAQYLLLLSMSGDAGLSELLTIDHEQAKIEIIMAATSSKEQRLVLDRVQRICDELGAVPEVSEVQVTGTPLLGRSMADLITEGQVQSLVLSLITVFLLVWPMVGSAAASLLCLVPIVITIIVNFGVMGWFGLSFNVVTALVTSVAVGMGIDYSIHMYTRHKEERTNGAHSAEAIAKATATTGYAVLLNAGAVTAGFLVLVLSAFQPMREFGALIAATMVVSATSAITVLPALLVTRAARSEKRAAATAHSTR
jgi:predicted RND superfamily exporter protein